MPPAGVNPRINSAWGAEELLQLVQAWEEVVDDPKDRLALSTAERSTLHARFCAIANSSKRSLSSVTRQHHRLCTSYLLIVETNKRAMKKGTPSWFELSAAEQHELRRVHNKKEKGMTVISQDLFRRLDRVCGGKGDVPADVDKSPLKRKKVEQRAAKKPVKKPRRSHHKRAEDEQDDEVDTPKIPWTSRDWALFVDAWEAAVDEFIDYGNEPDEKAKLPNWLIRQKFVELGGPPETSVGSITAKRRSLISSYQFILQCVSGLKALDGSDWFDLTFNERFRLQRKLVSPKSSQRVGCEVERDTYEQIGAIIEKEKLLESVTSRMRKQNIKKSRKESVSSDASFEDAGSRSPSPSRNSDADEVSDPDDAQFVRPVFEEEEDSPMDEQVVEALLEAQNSRFEQLMHDLREERMEERKQNQAMLLEILHQRTPPEEPTQNGSDMESLVSKQQEQLMDLFAQMHKERQQEREDFHALLRQLCSRPRA
jgi:hypothetical protein